MGKLHAKLGKQQEKVTSAKSNFALVKESYPLEVDEGAVWASRQ